MKVFLKKDVPGIGTANEVVEVSDGHARNYLLPRGLGVRATPGKIKAAQQYADSQALKAKRARERAEELAKLLSDACPAVYREGWGDGEAIRVHHLLGHRRPAPERSGNGDRPSLAGPGPPYP